MEKLNRAQKCSILGPQNLGSGGGPGPRGPCKFMHDGLKKRSFNLSNHTRMIVYENGRLFHEAN